MKYGIREICEVVLKAKSRMKVGNKIFYKDEPVIYFDSLKTSTMEGAATTVYAQGGRGNSRLIAWEGERTVTFTMEDALISSLGLAILTGADVIEPSAGKPIPVHVTETTDKVTKNSADVTITLDKVVSANADATIYVMLKDGDKIVSEAFIAQPVTEQKTVEGQAKPITVNTKQIKIAASNGYTPDLSLFDADKNVVIVDYYTDKETGVQQIEITPDKFGGNFYLEASTLFRDTNGVDMPAEFIIPNCKVQSNFTFSMASSGDPSTFTFTMDAFPDYTRFNKTKKVLSVIQVITEDSSDEYIRVATEADDTYDVSDKKKNRLRLITPEYLLPDEYARADFYLGEERLSEIESITVELIGAHDPKSIAVYQDGVIEVYPGPGGFDALFTIEHAGQSASSLSHVKPFSGYWAEYYANQIRLYKDGILINPAECRYEATSDYCTIDKNGYVTWEDEWQDSGVSLAARVYHNEILVYEFS